MTKEDILEPNIQQTKRDTPGGLNIVEVGDALNCMDEWAQQQAIAFAYWYRRKVYYNIGIGDFLWKDNDEIAPEIDAAFDIFKSEIPQ